MAIITISRQIGSLGDEIARATADKLGYAYIDRAQISESLSDHGFSLADIDRYDEKKPSVWQTLTMHRDLFSHFIRAAVCELAARNNVVIVGRGGQVILRDIPGVLRVKIIAPYAARVSRLAAAKGDEERVIKRLIQQVDSDTSGYLHTYFGADWDDADLYDLVLNTRLLTLSECVDLIARAAGAEQITHSSQVSAALTDLALTHKGKAVLLETTGRIDWMDLEVKKRVASLSGLVESSAIKTDCEKALAKIKGIESVENRLNVRVDDRRLY